MKILKILKIGKNVMNMIENSKAINRKFEVKISNTAQKKIKLEAPPKKHREKYL